MFRIVKLSDYATSLLSRMAREPGRHLSARQLSGDLALPVPTVAKLLKQLARAGLVQSLRGSGGGYCLARAPEMISLAEVIAAIEGPLALTECALGEGKCAQENICVTRSNWQRINRAVQEALASVSIAEMAAGTAAQPSP